ncbi:MAG: hypothetical protein AB7V46_22970 [Thermomicrobiales bacterium]
MYQVDSSPQDLPEHATPIAVVGPVHVEVAGDGDASANVTTGDLLGFAAALLAAGTSLWVVKRQAQAAQKLTALQNKFDSEQERLKVFLPERVTAIRELSAAMHQAWDSTSTMQIGAWDPTIGESAFQALRNADSQALIWLPDDVVAASANLLLAMGNLNRAAARCQNVTECLRQIWNADERHAFDRCYREMSELIRSTATAMETPSSLS